MAAIYLVPLITIVFLFYFTAIIYFRGHTYLEILNSLRKEKSKFAEVISNNLDTSNPSVEKINQIQLKALDGLKQIQEVLERFVEKGSSFPYQLFFSSRKKIVSRLSGRINILLPIITAGDLLNVIHKEEKLEELNSIRPLNLIFLILVISPLFLWSGSIASTKLVGEYTVKNLSLVVSLIWLSVLYMRHAKVESILLDIKTQCDEIALVSAMPFKEKAQLERFYKLAESLDISSKNFNKTVISLNDAIIKTPEQMAEMMSARLSEKISLTESLQSLKLTSDELMGTISSHAQVVRDIPNLLSDSVTKEVTQGLKPVGDSIETLRASLSNSYSNMSQALENTTVQLMGLVKNLTDTEVLEKLIEKLSNSSKGIFDVGRALNQYFNDTKQAGVVLQEISNCIQETQHNIAEQLADLSRLNQMRGLDETLFRQEIQGLFSSNLTKIENEHRNFSTIVDRFAQQVEKDADVRLTLREQIPNILGKLNHTTETLSELVEKSKIIPEQYKSIIQNIQKQAEENQTELYKTFRKNLDRFNEEQRKQQQTIISNFGTLQKSINDSIDLSVKNSNEQLTKQNNFLEHYLTHLASISQKHQNEIDSHLKEMNKVFSQAEKQSLQWANIQEKMMHSMAEMNEKSLQKMVSELQQGFNRFQDLEKRQSDKLAKLHVDSHNQINQLVSNSSGYIKQFNELLERADDTFKSLKGSNFFALINTLVFASALGLIIYKMFFRG